MGYQYGGAIHDVTPQPKPKRRWMNKFEPDACGTHAGYRRHLKYRVPVCPACRVAIAEYSRAHYNPGARKGFTTEECGTRAGHQRHLYHGVPPCEACLAAAREYQRAWRSTRKQVA